MNWETVDWVSVGLGLTLLMGVLLIISFLRREKAWLADVRKTNRDSTDTMLRAWDEALTLSAKRSIRLDQAHKLALEMQEWALPTVGDMISAVKVVEFSSRLLSITDWEECTYGSKQEEGVEADEGRFNGDEEVTSAGEEGAQGTA